MPEDQHEQHETDIMRTDEHGGDATSATGEAPTATADVPETPSGPAAREAQEDAGRAADRQGGAEDEPALIVGIGGSAGALGGFEEFFTAMPADSGAAFVVVPHLMHAGLSLMPELLQRCTTMPVRAITDGERVTPNAVHVLPAGHGLSVMNGALLLHPADRGDLRPIDHFMSSLAADVGGRAACVILSGSGNDGTDGARAVHDAGGVVMAQHPQVAEYPSMPQSVVDLNVAQHVLSAEELAVTVYRIARQGTSGEGRASRPGLAEPTLQKILLQIRSQLGHDFTRYKRGTLQRRIERRLKYHQLSDPEAYLKYLRESPREVEELFHDLTINVTSFFRDPDAFEHLRQHLRQYILEDAPDRESIRVWVAGCSTGEEAYSIAIILRELAEELADQRRLNVQIFATDIDPRAIETARAGMYTAAATATVGAERLRRYFEPRGDRYQVSPDVRDMVVFALHSTYGDPPFARLDLISCRNMLIYLDGELQTQLLPLFHYALKPSGLLFLGTSESIGRSRELFDTLDNRWKIFRRRAGTHTSMPMNLQPTASIPTTPRAVRTDAAPAAPQRDVDVKHLVQGLLLADYAPAAVVVTAAGNIVFISGHTSRYLEFPHGRPSTNLAEMARDALRYELPPLLRQAAAERREVTRRGVHMHGEGAPRLLDLIVRPLPVPASTEPLLLVVFDEQPGPDGAAPETPVPATHRERVTELERELVATGEYLQATIEEMNISLEELRSTNEELQTSNEELQSSNEELMTSKEELQSLNEELVTVNAEHQHIISDLAQANDDMKNLLDSMGIATVFIGNDLSIKRFTPRITSAINLIPTDIGRPITHISTNLREDHLKDHIAHVLETLTPYEAQVQTHDGTWYLLRITPYRTSENFIDGAVLVFTDISGLKELEQQLRVNLLYSQAVLNSMSDPLLVLDQDLRVVRSNQALLDLLHVRAEQIRGQLVFDIGDGQLQQSELKDRVREVLNTERPLLNYLVDIDVPRGGERKMKVEVQPVVSDQDVITLFMLKMEDVTPILRRAARDGADISGDTVPPPSSRGTDAE